MKTVGERHWTHGPILLASSKLHQRFVKAFTHDDAKPLKRLKKAVGVAEVAGESVAFLGCNEETGLGRCRRARPWSRTPDTCSRGIG